VSGSGSRHDHLLRHTSDLQREINRSIAVAAYVDGVTLLRSEGRGRRFYLVAAGRKRREPIPSVAISGGGSNWFVLAKKLDLSASNHRTQRIRNRSVNVVAFGKGRRNCKRERQRKAGAIKSFIV